MVNNLWSFFKILMVLCLDMKMTNHCISYISLNEQKIHKCMIFLSIKTTSTSCEFVFWSNYSKPIFLVIIGVNGYVWPKTHWSALHGHGLPIVFQYLSPSLVECCAQFCYPFGVGTLLQLQKPIFLNPQFVI
jgi:hypothetical protein